MGYLYSQFKINKKGLYWGIILKKHGGNAKKAEEEIMRSIRITHPPGYAGYNWGKKISDMDGTGINQFNKPNKKKKIKQ